MHPADLTNWRQGYGLNKTAAAEHLGISRRALFNYEQGARPIPRAVELACQAPVDHSALGLERVVTYRKKGNSNA